MDVGLLNASVLLGLGAVLIPPLLHLLRRRRGEVIDWGAMQFLPDGSTRRRRRLEELLLLMLRMGALGLLVVGLAAPYAVSPWLAALGDGPSRDVVLVIDGSYSMDRRTGAAVTPGAAARRWAEDFIANLGPGDRAALVLARQPPVVWQELLTGDARLLGARLAELPAPCGNPDLPGAVGQAWDLLQRQGRAATRQIIVLGDGQRHGLTDPTMLRQWEALTDPWRSEVERRRAAGEPVPGLWLVDVAGAGAAPNFALGPLQALRGIALSGQALTFRGTLEADGFATPARPRRLTYAIDGKRAGEVAVPEALSAGRAPLAFTHRFETAGLHVVTLALEPAADRDSLPADNEQHAVIEVFDDLPVLLVDGDPQLGPDSSTFFLQRALTRPGKGRPPRAIPAAELGPRDLGAPAVVVLADVPRLTEPQVVALDRYVAEGGSLLVAVGERAGRGQAFYNERLYRAGAGWLPAKLSEIAAAAADPARPDLKSFTHPALSLLVNDTQGGLGQVRFPRWWKTAAAEKAPAAVVGLLSSGDALLLEKPCQKGRVVLCTVPLDRRWDSTLPSTWEYPVLVNELVTYLAGVRADAHRLAPGEPLRFQPRGALTELSLSAPGRPEHRVEVTRWPWRYDDTGALGVYQVRAGAETVYFVRPPDLRESDLTAASEEELGALAALLPVPLQRERPDAAVSLAQPRQELWWVCWLGVIALLCGEVWLTRRLVRRGGRVRP